MASIATAHQILTSTEASEAMLDGLTERIRAELRKKIVERIEPDINAAIDAAMESFKIAIEAHRDHYHMQDTIRVLLERR